tara:strand:- start:922 stop:1077 length:156 start_codon:yes stop_codon:yes gene_type:complete
MQKIDNAFSQEMNLGIQSTKNYLSIVNQKVCVTNPYPQALINSIEKRLWPK